MIFTLRDYQAECINVLDQLFIAPDCDSALICLPPGTGKTKTAIAFCMRWLGMNPSLKIHWVAHSPELLWQAGLAIKELQEAFGVELEKPISYWTRYSKDDTGTFVLIMAYSARNLQSHCDIRIIDEAHHEAAPTYRMIRENSKASFDVGLTATPTRLDGKSLDYKVIAYQKTMMEMAGKWIAIPRYMRFKTGLRYNLVKSGVDFTTRSLRSLNNKDRNEVIVREYIAHREFYGKTIIYAVDAKHVLDLVACMNAMDPSVRVSFILDERHVTLKERNTRLREFQEGSTEVMINCRVLTEGIDAPATKTIFLARPTASETLWLQMASRGDRLAPGKTEFYIVDFVDSGTGMYNLMAREWSTEFLGAIPPKEEGEEEAQKAKDIRERLARHKIKVSLVKIQLEYLRFIGLLRVGSKWKKRNKTYLITHEQWNCLQGLLYSLSEIMDAESSRPDLYNFIDGSFGLYVPNEEFSNRDWRLIAWAAYFRFVKGLEKFETGTDTFVWVPFQDVETSDTEIRARLREMKERNDRLNTVWHNRPEELFVAVAKNAEEELGDFAKLIYKMKPIEYNNRVLILCSPVPQRRFNKDWKCDMFWKCKDVMQAHLRDVLEDDGAIVRIVPKL